MSCIVLGRKPSGGVKTSVPLVLAFWLGNQNKTAHINNAEDFIMTEIFRTIAGSRLYGTANADSDTDFKAVHLPTKRQILLGRRDTVISRSTGSQDSRNGADDVDVESFELQRFLKLASDMQTIPVEMLFVPMETCTAGPVWARVLDNRDKILSRNTKAFVGYCKGQAVRYSMRGKRLETYERVCSVLESDGKVIDVVDQLTPIPGVMIIHTPQPRDKVVPFLDVYGRQCPTTISCKEARKIYRKPVEEAGQRARAAKEAGGMDNKALYHAVRIADEGISLFSTGKIEFPCQNLGFLMKIRAGEVEIDEFLDVFDEKIAILADIGSKSPLREYPDRVWIDDFVADVYEEIVRA
jgi:hypothetical protein